MAGGGASFGQPCQPVSSAIGFFRFADSPSVVICCGLLRESDQSITAKVSTTAIALPLLSQRCLADNRCRRAEGGPNAECCVCSPTRLAIVSEAGALPVCVRTLVVPAAGEIALRNSCTSGSALPIVPEPDA